MKLHIFSVNDSVAETFGAPFLMANLALAKRAVSDLVNDGQSRIALNPGDYNLFLLGTFDEDTGIVEAITPQLILNARSLKS